MYIIHTYSHIHRQASASMRSAGIATKARISGGSWLGASGSSTSSSISGAPPAQAPYRKASQVAYMFICCIVVYLSPYLL